MRRLPLMRSRTYARALGQGGDVRFTISNGAVGARLEEVNMGVGWQNLVIEAAYSVTYRSLSRDRCTRLRTTETSAKPFGEGKIRRLVAQPVL